MRGSTHIRRGGEADMGGPWSLEQYPEDIRAAYLRLHASSLQLPLPHAGPYSSDLDSTLQASLHRLINRFPAAFVELVELEMQNLAGFPEPSSTAASTVLRRGLNPLLSFNLRLRRTLDDATRERAALLGVREDLLAQCFGSLGSSDVTMESMDWQDEELWRSCEGAEEGLNERRTSVSPSKRSATDITPTTEKSKRSRPSLEQADSESSEELQPSIYQILPQRKNSSKTVRQPLTAQSSMSTVHVDLSDQVPTAANSRLPTPLTSPDDEDVTPPLVVTHGPAARPLQSPWRAVYALEPTPYQARLNKLGVSFHVQWELERRLSQHPTLSWDDIGMDDLAEIAGPATESAPKLESLLRLMAARKSGGHISGSDAGVKAVGTRKAMLLAEVDREEESIVANDLRGLYDESPDWPYGGKIVYTMAIQRCSGAAREERLRYVPSSLPTTSLRPRRSVHFDKLSTQAPDHTGPTDTPDNPFGLATEAGPPQQDDDHLLPWTIRLLPPSMPGRSCRLARRFGSRRVISLKLQQPEERARKTSGEPSTLFELVRGRTFVVFGRAYQGLWAPDKDSVFLVEVGGEVDGVVRRHLRELEMPSLLEMYKRYNDLEQKRGQAMAKWGARFQLVMSDTVPAGIVSARKIGMIDDIVTAAAMTSGHATTEQTLTDGCGLMSVDLARRIFNRYRSLKLDTVTSLPCVVQIRLGGSKGLLALMSPAEHAAHPDEDVLLRPSMLKALPDPSFADDPSLSILDIVKCGSLRTDVSLSAEPIMCMVHNGVPIDVILRMAERGLDDLRDAFSTRPLEGESEDEALRRFIASCYRQGGVGAERRKREVAEKGVSARAAGLRREKDELLDIRGDGDGPDLISNGERFEVDPISGQPGSISEALYDATVAGFHPLHSAYTNSKLHRMMSVLTDSLTRRFKIPSQRSISAFIVPDPLGVLAPHEIFVAFSSQKVIDPDTQRPLTHLSGPCLAFRSPCKLPTDVRKFEAVWRPELAHLQDCVVMSASSDLCRRSPASMLGGGDYDGDEVQVFWDPELVERFRNAPEEIADLPEGFEEQNFDKEVLRGEAVSAELEGEGGQEKVERLQDFALGALGDESLAGTYSDLHGNAVYTLGYGHAETIRLALMFCLVLDARKSGLRIKAEILKNDVRTYGGELEWRLHKAGKQDDGNRRVLRRPKKLGVSVMDALMEAGKVKSQDVMRHFPSELATPSTADHDILSTLYRRAEAFANISFAPVMLEEELSALRQHVKACFEVWEQIRQCRLPRSAIVEDSYLAAKRGRLPPSPFRTPHSNASPAKRHHNVITDDEPRVLLTQMRALARVFRDGLEAAEVPLLSQYGDEAALRRIKISCAATFGWTPRQVFVFDMDFRTSCALRAEAAAGARGGGERGGAMVVMERVGRGLKPGWKVLD